MSVSNTPNPALVSGPPATGAIVANLGYVEIDCSGYSSLSVTFTGTMSAGRVDFGTSVDAFATEDTIPGHSLADTSYDLFSLPQSLFYSGMTWMFDVANLGLVRFTARGSFSGSLTLTYRLGIGGVTLLVGTPLGIRLDTAVSGDNPGTISAKLRGANKTLGNTNDAAASTDTGTASQIALVKRLLQKAAATGQVQLSDGTFLEVLQAPIAFSTSGNHTIVAGVANFQIRLHAAIAMVGDDTELEWRSGATTVIVGAMPVAARGGYEVNWLPNGFLAECDEGEAATLNSSIATTVGGSVNYSLVPA